MRKAWFSGPAAQGTRTDMTDTSSAKTYYDAAAGSYNKLYDLNELMKSNIYPANYFRLQKLLKCFNDPKIRRIVEIGLGEGTPAFTLARAGKDVYGFDISEKMVVEARARLKDANVPEDRVIQADINDPISYLSLTKDGLFDGLVAMGVMQHMEKDDYVLSNMAELLHPGGRAFIMFRNKLFSLFTMNRYTYEFIMDDLLAGVSRDVKEAVGAYLTSILRMDLPLAQRDVVTTDKSLDKPVFSKFHNPFEVESLFHKTGFGELKFHWYHYHPAMPSLESRMPKDFRREALSLEHEQSGWRGMFLCSAFVVEAVKNA